MLSPRVLIIEEDLTHQRLATLMCAKHGVTSAVVSTTDEAIKELNAHSGYTAILLDLGIPQSTRALHCVQQLLAIRRNRQLPFRIVAITAHAMVSDSRDCQQLGTDEYLSMPYTTQQFGEMLNRVHGQSLAKRQAS